MEKAARHFSLMLFLLLMFFPSVASWDSSKPFRESELLALVAGGALPETVLREIDARGVSFHPDDLYRSQLKDVGADVRILKELDAAKVVTGAGEDQPDKELLRHLSNAGKLMKARSYTEAAGELNAALTSKSERAESGVVMGELLRQLEAGPEAAELYRRD